MRFAYNYDPELAAALALRTDISIGDLDTARARLEEFASSDETTLEGIDRLRIINRIVPEGSGHGELLVRLFIPLVPEAPLPGVAYYHPGGFVLGSVDGDHDWAAAMAIGTRAMVASVEYRLAPEHPYPAALEDCYAALLWMNEVSDEVNLDRNRIAVAGTSAGGNLAAAVCLLARDRNGPLPCFQLLSMPALDDRLETPSMLQFTDTPGWDRASAELSWRYYLGPGSGDDVPPYAAPARACDLSGLPPAYISTAQFDPLRDEGIAYATRLLQAGVATELHNFAGAFHGSDTIRSAELSQRQTQEAYAALRRALGVPPT